MKHKKTNAMRMLDRAKVDYEVRTFEVSDGHMDGKTIAHIVGANVEDVYKTLVLENANHDHFVFVIPVNETLDLKEAAHVVNEKKLTLMPMENLKQVTGYIRGGCSPIGMKHLFKTTIDQSALERDKIHVSGGQRGIQIVVNIKDLIDITNAQTADILQK
ncbi:Cys-tRNA(Pro) deacylase [Staphylococcus sp. NRL 16/872]|uniref:Cys-tRNA(Pro) deacylase n=1 Tax=Staphylococcus sp. NRL 16/872 TaxID=2930131 RepID=UPI001FB1DEFD|nr:MULTISPECIES: Cys-tRNA(Pro) deacylase [unclassified Staphylococcus]MCJ1656947.1 Cys-tRNA(Pro) deacylase [Staphylococcus sp. NRL 21/187]MCJ1662694.1 Cys-tRNA(Pro) deacylase [Staphylococcus sp. NRL 18/288]MCJ1668799.1 Cys-tRNA(Pro) deacylase [Staphylococcus sp. NRL 19/737]WEN69018.1 Cys-tRNA(Pro) deacylase [Staphylococcus sp. NRL 16/872]